MVEVNKQRGNRPVSEMPNLTAAFGNCKFSNKVLAAGKRLDIFSRCITKKDFHFCATAFASQDEMKKRQAAIMSKGLPKQKPIPGVDKILLVASGKGGVGKSTTAVNLAVALKRLNPSKNVGLLDADVYGPSVPIMMNLDESPLIDKNNLMVPLTNYGVKCMSMGFLIATTGAAVWRGLMVMSAIDRLTRQVAWAPLDWLVVDTPPGTGDTHLSLAQTLPVAGALLVTGPGAAAHQVTRRGAFMFQKLGVPLAGLVANMSSLDCPKCGHKTDLSATSAQKLAQEIGVSFVVDIPVSEDVRDGGDSGQPAATKPNEYYDKLACEMKVFLEKSDCSYK